MGFWAGCLFGNLVAVCVVLGRFHRARKKIVELTDLNYELEQLFDLQYTRTAVANSFYIEANPRPDGEFYQADLGRLVEWLMLKAGLPWKQRQRELVEKDFPEKESQP